MYEQRMADGSTKMLVGSVESVTVNFTVREGLYLYCKIVNFSFEILHTDVRHVLWDAWFGPTNGLFCRAIISPGGGDITQKRNTDNKDG